MARTYAAWARIRERDRAAAYARRVLVNRYRSLARRARVEARHLLTTRPEDRYEPDLSGDSQLLWEALGRLPARQRSAIVLRFYLDLPEAGGRAPPRRLAGDGQVLDPPGVGPAA